MLYRFIVLLAIPISTLLIAWRERIHDKEASFVDLITESFGLVLLVMFTLSVVSAALYLALLTL